MTILPPHLRGTRTVQLPICVTVDQYQRMKSFQQQRQHERIAAGLSDKVTMSSVARDMIEIGLRYREAEDARDEVLTEEQRNLLEAMEGKL